MDIYNPLRLFHWTDEQTDPVRRVAGLESPACGLRTQTAHFPQQPAPGGRAPGGRAAVHRGFVLSAQRCEQAGLPGWPSRHVRFGIHQSAHGELSFSWRHLVIITTLTTIY